ncbi:AAA family ATPase [Sphingobacterium endophyticum]|uniref:AAA family ATPase n=1 Tax=Sphingobacterium endophyticum TaxID=2546448 RepID=UPI0012E30916|nr:AAA family ATPase [Sphingobacterium endophyticum]
MKIKSLWISKYKNVENIELKFDTDLISLMVGQNGFGKSNLLEALSLIFRDLDLMDTLSDYEDWPYDTRHFEFKIQYQCKGLDIKINCLKSEFHVYAKKVSDEQEFEDVNFSEFRKNKQTRYLPDYVVGYYSGENKRIREVIKPYEEIIIKDLKSNKGLDSGFRKMFFAENFHSQMILLTLLLYRNDNNGFSRCVNDLHNNYLSFHELEEFGIRLNSPDWFDPRRKEHQAYGVNQLEENLQTNNVKSFPFWNSKGKANKILQLLYEENGEPPIYYEEKEKDKLPKEYLELNSIVLTSKLKKIFPTPIDFFDAFETIYCAGLLSSIHLNVKNKNNLVYEFAELSEGEQQLVTVLGLILITGKDDCLFLLDEPDTHLNPKWQRDYIKLLTDFNLNHDNSHIFVATHSPLIVQAVEGKFDILLYHLNEEENIQIDNDPQIISNWRIDQVLASKYFGIENTRPIKTDDFLKLKQEIIRKGGLTDTDKANLKALEDELGYLPLGETITEIESLAFLNKLANKHDIH